MNKMYEEWGEHINIAWAKFSLFFLLFFILFGGNFREAKVFLGGSPPHPVAKSQSRSDDSRPSDPMIRELPKSIINVSDLFAQIS